MKDKVVNKIENNVRKAQDLLEEAARLLCNEPGDTPGGILWTLLSNKSQEIASAFNYTYRLRDWE